MVFCTKFLDGWWSQELLHGSCFRCGWCRAVAQHHPHCKHNPCSGSWDYCPSKNSVQKIICWSLQHGYYSNPTTPNCNTHRTKNNSTNVVIQQNSRKLLMVDILISEICWAHKKWNKIASDIKLVFYSSTITTMQGPIYITVCKFLSPFIV